MTKKIITVFTLLVCIFACLTGVFTVCAAQENADNSPVELMCIAYRGDTSLYEQNSKEAVLSAFMMGADFVSVNIRKNADAELVLCSENEVEVVGTPLKEILPLLNEDEILILDFENALADEIYDLLIEENALSKAYFRIKDSADKINEWVLSKNEAPVVIGVSSSFNVFTVRSFVKKLSAAPAVQLQSKNYFNVMYGSVCYEQYASQNVIAPMYDPDLCGQRSDSEDGWNDLIKKNFNIIETNNVEAFIDYKNNAQRLKSNLLDLLAKAENTDVQAYSLVSRENLAQSIENAKAILWDSAASCDELQSTASALQRAMNKLTPSQGEDTQRGALNITPGKIVAAVFVALFVLAGQIYVEKMQKEKKR